jgi:putative endonuclease
MARRKPADAARLAAYRRGLSAETVAAWLLRAKLYRILARRYRTPAGEIDVIARRGRTIVFVEVKTRPSETEALEAVGPTARRRIARAAELWLAAHPGAAGFDLRFDLVIVVPGRPPRHVAAVFDAEGRL